MLAQAWTAAERWRLCQRAGAPQPLDLCGRYGIFIEAGAVFFTTMLQLAPLLWQLYQQCKSISKKRIVNKEYQDFKSIFEGSSLASSLVTQQNTQEEINKAAKKEDAAPIVIGNLPQNQLDYDRQDWNQRIRSSSSNNLKRMPTSGIRSKEGIDMLNQIRNSQIERGADLTNDNSSMDQNQLHTPRSYSQNFEVKGQMSTITLAKFGDDPQMQIL